MHHNQLFTYTLHHQIFTKLDQHVLFSVDTWSEQRQMERLKCLKGEKQEVPIQRN